MMDIKKPCSFSDFPFVIFLIPEVTLFIINYVACLPKWAFCKIYWTENPRLDFFMFAHVPTPELPGSVVQGIKFLTVMIKMKRRANLHHRSLKIAPSFQLAPLFTLCSFSACWSQKNLGCHLCDIPKYN